MLVEREDFKEEDGSLAYIESVFNSDNVLKTTYFPTLARLYIAFNRGGTYSYSNISPEFYKEFEEADSQGKFFHVNINRKKEYPFRKEFTLYPSEIEPLRERVNEFKKKIEELKLENKEEDED